MMSNNQDFALGNGPVSGFFLKELRCRKKFRFLSCDLTLQDRAGTGNSGCRFDKFEASPAQDRLRNNIRIHFGPGSRDNMDNTRKPAASRRNLF